MQVVRQMEYGNAEPLPVDLSSVALKHIGAEWLYRAYEHRLQLSWNLWDSSGFLEFGLVPQH